MFLTKHETNPTPLPIGCYLNTSMPIKHSKETRIGLYRILTSIVALQPCIPTTTPDCPSNWNVWQVFSVIGAFSILPMCTCGLLEKTYHLRVHWNSVFLRLLPTVIMKMIYLQKYHTESKVFLILGYLQTNRKFSYVISDSIEGIVVV